jgi:hypothetical protein
MFKRELSSDTASSPKQEISPLVFGQAAKDSAGALGIASQRDQPAEVEGMGGNVNEDS